jgi:hypothetical protein
MLLRIPGLLRTETMRSAGKTIRLQCLPYEPAVLGMADEASAIVGPIRRTSDGRYYVVCGWLCRLGNPALEFQEREHLVRALMITRREIRSAQNDLGP